MTEEVTEEMTEEMTKEMTKEMMKEATILFSDCDVLIVMCTIDWALVCDMRGVKTSEE